MVSDYRELISNICYIFARCILKDVGAYLPMDPKYFCLVRIHRKVQWTFVSAFVDLSKDVINSMFRVVFGWFSVRFILCHR